MAYSVCSAGPIQISLLMTNHDHVDEDEEKKSLPVTRLHSFCVSVVLTIVRFRNEGAVKDKVAVKNFSPLLFCFVEPDAIWTVSLLLSQKYLRALPPSCARSRLINLGLIRKVHAGQEGSPSRWSCPPSSSTGSASLCGVFLV